METMTPSQEIAHYFTIKARELLLDLHHIENNLANADVAKKHLYNMRSVLTGIDERLRSVFTDPMM